MKLSALKILIACTFLLTVGGISAEAHTDGASIEVPVGSYLLDIGYSPELTTVGAQTRFDFLILNAETKEGVQFDDIWVRIEKENQVFFAGGLGKQRFGNTGLTYLFPEPGTYQVFVRFGNEGESLAETTFDLPVNASNTDSGNTNFLANKVLLVLAGVAFGAMLVWLAGRRQVKKNNSK